MKRSQTRITGLVRRWSSVVLIVVLIAGGISLASFGQGMGTGDSFKVDGAELRSGKRATPSQATMANAFACRATSSNLAELLEQTSDMDESVVPTRLEVILDGKRVIDSDNWGITWQSGQVIAADAQIRHRIQADFYPRNGGIEVGDSVTWNLGRIEGLNLEPEYWEPLEIGNKYVADIWLYYTQGGEIFLHTKFCEDINRMGDFNVTYWYDSGFSPVKKRTELEMDLPGLSEPGYVILLPKHGDDDEPTLPEETQTPETEETTTEETTAAGTTGGHSGNDSNSSSGRDKVRDPVPETSATIETESSLSATAPEKEQQPQTEQKEPSAEQAGADQAESTDETKETESATQAVAITLTEETVSGLGTQGQALSNEVITYRMTIENNSKEAMKDVRIRSYLADRTSFVSAGGVGVYGVMNGKQHITWHMEHIAPGGKQELIFEVKVFACIPVNYSIDNRVFWQADDKRSVNNPEDLLNEIVFPEITIG